MNLISPRAEIDRGAPPESRWRSLAGKLRSIDAVTVVLALAGLLLRLEYLREFSSALNFDLALGADVLEYDARAREILNGRLFPTQPEIHGAIYPFFLAFLYWIGGFSIPFVRLIQLLLNWCSWLILEYVLGRFGVSQRVRRWFLALAMFYPVLFFHQAELISESLLLPLFTGFLLLISGRGVENGRRPLRLTASGVVLGVAALVHGMALAAGVVEVLYLCWRRRYRSALLMVAGITLVLLPSIVVKSVHYGRPVGLQANSGFNIWLGNNPESTGGCWLRPGFRWRQLHAEAEREAVQRGVGVNRIWLGRAAQFWIAEPLHGCRLYLKKIPRIFAVNELISGADPGELVCYTDLVFFGRFFTIPLFFMAAIGGWRRWCTPGERWRSRHLFLLFAAFFLIQLLTVTSGRYRQMMMVPVLVFAASGITVFNWRRYWFLPVFAIGFAGIFGFTFHRSNRAEAASLYGEAALYKGKTALAEDLLRFAAARIDDPARFDNLLGIIAERQGKRAAAKAYYRSAISREPDRHEAHLNLGVLLGGEPGREEEARAEFVRALELAPENASGHYNFARFLSAGGDFAGAESECRNALEDDRFFAPAWNLLGVFRANRNDLSGALACFRRAEELDPREEGYRANRQAMENVINAATVR